MAHHRVVVVGGGTAGVTVAALLERAGVVDVAVVEPSSIHWYQPLWTLVGGGCAPIGASARPTRAVLPSGVQWVRDAVAELDPDGRRVHLAGGGTLGYDILVCCPGVELAWDMVPGLAEAVAGPRASSNYAAHLAPKTWQLLEDFRGGHALFTAPASPIKCPGAPQKIAYLACDHWRRTGRLGAAEVTFASGAGGLFGVPEFRAVLDQVVARYGIDARFRLDLVEVDDRQREAVFAPVPMPGTPAPPTDSGRVRLPYDLLHAAPPQRPPAFVRESPLADPASPLGWLLVDPATLAHPGRPEVFALGDVTTTPNSKTGAAVRRQAPVAVANVLAALAGDEPAARYDGYGACPFTTARGKVVMAEFDYTGRPHPTVPFVDTAAERRDMWLVKRYGLPAFYWHLMLKGRDPAATWATRPRPPAPPAPRGTGWTGRVRRRSPVGSPPG